MTITLEDKAYFLMDKTDYLLHTLALGLAVQEITRLTGSDEESCLEYLRQAAEVQAKKLLVKGGEASHIYVHDRDTPENKILAAIVDDKSVLRVL